MEDTTNTEAILSRLREGTKATSDSDLGRKLGVGQQAVSNARKGNKVPDSWIRRAAIIFGLSMDWLYFGKGNMRLNHSETSVQAVSPEGRQLPQLEPSSENVMIPLVGARISAGLGSLETGGEVEEYIPFPRVHLSCKGPIEKMVFMRVSGDSMEPVILHGDKALINLNDVDLYPGLIYAVGVEDMIFLKTVSAMPGKIILSSYNEKYPPIEIDTSEQLEDLVRIIGRCIHIARDL